MTPDQNDERLEALRTQIEQRPTRRTLLVHLYSARRTFDSLIRGRSLEDRREAESAMDWCAAAGLIEYAMVENKTIVRITDAGKEAASAWVSGLRE